MKRVLVVILGAACGVPTTPPRAPQPVAAPATATPAPRGSIAPGTAEPTPAPTPARAAGDTALKTRVHPFALYIARMHRRLHERWGVGFLASLDQRPATDLLNDPTLAVTVELAIDTQGALADVQVLKPSHQAAFDQAAVDAFHAAAPFDAPPETIRSKDGLVHLRWTLHRDQRECGTAGVDPILE